MTDICCGVIALIIVEYCEINNKNAQNIIVK